MMSTVTLKPHFNPPQDATSQA